MKTTYKPRKAVRLTPNQLRALLDRLDAASAGDGAGADQRRSRRLRYRSERVRVTILNGRGESLSSFYVPSRNLSAHGMSFVYGQMLPAGQQLDITLPLLDEGLAVVKATVKRCRHVEGMIHEVGIEFC